jgi:hypothetical protein
MPDFIVVREQPQPEIIEVEKPEKQTVIEIMAGTQGPPGVKGEDGNVNDYDPGDLIVYFENQLL